MERMDELVDAQHPFFRRFGERIIMEVGFDRVHRRSAEQLALDLLTSSVEHDEWFRREVEKGRASARSGRLLDRDELVARIEKRYRA